MRGWLPAGRPALAPAAPKPMFRLLSSSSSGRSTPAARLLQALLALSAAPAAWAQASLVVPEPQGEPHLGLLALCAILFAVVFAAMLIVLWRHRVRVRRRGERMDESWWVELCWNLIPLLIVLGAAWPVFRLLTV